jgi:hypothetical protein
MRLWMVCSCIDFKENLLRDFWLCSSINFVKKKLWHFGGCMVHWCINLWIVDWKSAFWGRKEKLNNVKNSECGQKQNIVSCAGSTVSKRLHWTVDTKRPCIKTKAKRITKAPIFFTVSSQSQVKKNERVKVLLSK